MPVVQIKEVDLEREIEEFDLEPYGSRLVVVEKEAEKYGQLYIPDSAKTKDMQTNEGFVIAVGNDVDFCKPGEAIYYARYSGAWIERGGKKYRIMNEEDILGRVK